MSTIVVNLMPDNAAKQAVESWRGLLKDAGVLLVVNDSGINLAVFGNVNYGTHEKIISVAIEDAGQVSINSRTNFEVRR